MLNLTLLVIPMSSQYVVERGADANGVFREAKSTIYPSPEMHWWAQQQQNTWKPTEND